MQVCGIQACAPIHDAAAAGAPKGRQRPIEVFELKMDTAASVPGLIAVPRPDLGGLIALPYGAGASGGRDGVCHQRQA